MLNNALVGNGASGYGGGVYCFSESIQLANNMIVGNQAAVYGGGIYSPGSSMIVNNTIAANSSGWGGGVAFFFSPTIINNIIAFNSSGLYTSGGSPDLRNNCVFNPCGADYTNLYPGIGDISLHPQHMREPDAGPDQKWGTADDDYGDLRLRPGSPCIDVGGVSMIGTYLTHDIRGRDRFVDDPSSADCRWVPGPCGFAPIVDIGAFEFQAVPGDFDGNEEVDADDLAAFEACGSGPAIASTADCHWADLDHDNDVDADDFAAFQRSYAPSAGM